MKDKKRDIKANGNQKFINIDHRKVDSVIKMYEGVDSFVKYVNQHGTAEFRTLFVKYDKKNIKDLLNKFKAFCIP